MEREWILKKETSTDVSSSEEAKVELTVLQWNILSQVILLFDTFLP